jgi:hypothetical protein
MLLYYLGEVKRKDEGAIMILAYAQKKFEKITFPG